MAEFVQLRLEEMRPELEQYSKFQLFAPEDIRKITIQRREYEYKVHKHSKSKDDYLKYIQYEVDLLKLLRLKLEKFKVEENTSKVKRELCKFIVNRVMSLFFYSVSRFPEDIKLWLTFIKFCKTERKFSEVSKNLERMLKFHGSKEEMWKIAANWEYMKCRNIETARGFLLTGLRHHPQSEFIFIEAIWLELKYADNLRKARLRRARQEGKEPDLSRDVILNGGLADVMYETALDNVNTCHFLCEVLRVAMNFQFASELQRKIKENLLTNHSENPETWIFLAKLELSCFTFEGNFSLPLLYRRLRREETLAPTKKQIVYAYDLLHNAVHDINTEGMWTDYIELFLELLDEAANPVKKTFPNLIRRLLKEALEAAHIQAKLASHLYRYYVDTLGNDLRAIDEVLADAADRHPSCLELWIARLNLSFVKDTKAKSQKVFQAATNQFKDSDEVLELWLIMTEHFSKDKSLLDDLFQLSLPKKTNAAEKVKIMYIDHILESKGLATCRTLYNKLSITPPFSLELHKKLIEVETKQPKIDVKQVRKCFELACDQFGSKNPDLWMEYVNFEMSHGSKPLITGIYTRASKTLEPAHSDTFMQLYSNLQSSFM